MIDRDRKNGGQKAQASAEYRRVFVLRVHQLLELGYRRTAANRFHAHQETEITGELVRAMDDVIDDAKSPRWVRQFSVHDDPPINTPGRLGRARKRLDIKIVSAQRWPRSRFSFEAKRLGANNSIGQYLGPDGLGCFLAGHYAADEPDAGMLGYVQADSPGEWATKMEKEFADSATALCLVPGSSWETYPMRAAPMHTFRTRHVRQHLGRDIEVYHTLLLCC